MSRAQTYCGTCGPSRWAAEEASRSEKAGSAPVPVGNKLRGPGGQSFEYRYIYVPTK